MYNQQVEDSVINKEFDQLAMEQKIKLVWILLVTKKLKTRIDFDDESFLIHIAKTATTAAAKLVHDENTVKAINMSTETLPGLKSILLQLNSIFEELEHATRC